jgi:chemotaxis response regulator CheB
MQFNSGLLRRENLNSVRIKYMTGRDIIVPGASAGGVKALSAIARSLSPDGTPLGCMSNHERIFSQPLSFKT